MTDQKVYGKFLGRSAWPKELDESVFEEIKKILNVLIIETEVHKKQFLDLRNKLKKNAQK